MLALETQFCFFVGVVSRRRATANQFHVRSQIFISAPVWHRYFRAACGDISSCFFICVKQSACRARHYPPALSSKILSQKHSAACLCSQNALLFVFYIFVDKNIPFVARSISTTLNLISPCKRTGRNVSFRGYALRCDDTPQIATTPPSPIPPPPTPATCGGARTTGASTRV